MTGPGHLGEQRDTRSMSGTPGRRDSTGGGERKTVLHNVARSLVSMVRSSGIRKDYIVHDDHGAVLPFPVPSDPIRGPGRCRGAPRRAQAPLC